MNENLQDDFLDLGDTSELDNLLLSEGGEDELVEKMHDQKEKSVAERTPWIQDFGEHWYWYLILALSFLLTETTAIYLGLAPKIVTNAAGLQEIEWHTDFAHVATAFVYMLIFPAVTELAFDRAWKKYSKRETGNFAQQWTMIVAIAASVLSILATGISGFYVVLSTLGSVGFLQIPRSVQLWIIIGIPFLLSLFAILHGVYKAKSKQEKARKLVAERIANAEISDQLRNGMIEQKARRAARAVARHSFMRAVARGLLSHKEMDEAMAQGKSLVQLEKELNRDLTGEGKIGDTSGLNRPALPHPSEKRPVLTDNPRYGPEWKNSTDITPTLDTYAWSCLNCDGSNAPYTRKCQWCGQPRTNGSPVTAFADLPPTHPQRQAPRGLYDEPSYNPVGMEPKSRDGKNGQSFT